MQQQMAEPICRLFHRHGLARSERHPVQRGVEAGVGVPCRVGLVCEGGGGGDGGGKRLVVVPPRGLVAALQEQLSNVRADDGLKNTMGFVRLAS
jgi:hypothetical protein